MTEMKIDLIDRQAAIDALEKVAGFFPYKTPGVRETYNKYNEAWNDAIGRAEVEIESLPSAQPERKKGKWLGKPIAGSCTVRCSACGDAFLEISGEWNFCPNCGAGMRRVKA